MKTKNEKIPMEPEQLHKRQTTFQVLLPVIAISAICLGLCIFLLISTYTEPQSTEQWAQISTMFLILPALLLGLVCLAFLILLGVFAGKWNKSWPPALRNLRLIIIQFESNLQGLAQKPAQPVIWIKSTFAGIKTIFKK
ncbi:hypothetical protein EG832_03355 [bacterium]|nr:hypothetical protein [bacterium]